jgi:hypothetical protein
MYRRSLERVHPQLFNEAAPDFSRLEVAAREEITPRYERS